MTPAGTSNELDVQNEWEENTHTRIIDPPWEDQCEGHTMTRMTRPDCAVMCNLINTHTHKHIRRLSNYYKPSGLLFCCVANGHLFFEAESLWRIFRNLWSSWFVRGRPRCCHSLAARYLSVLLFNGLNAWTVVLFCARGVSGSRRHDIARGEYTHLACLLLSCVTFHCSSSTSR